MVAQGVHDDVLWLAAAHMMVHAIHCCAAIPSERALVLERMCGEDEGEVPPLVQSMACFVRPMLGGRWARTARDGMCVSKSELRLLGILVRHVERVFVRVRVEGYRLQEVTYSEEEAEQVARRQAEERRLSAAMHNRKQLLAIERILFRVAPSGSAESLLLFHVEGPLRKCGNNQLATKLKEMLLDVSVDESVLSGALAAGREHGDDVSMVVGSALKFAIKHLAPTLSRALLEMWTEDGLPVCAAGRDERSGDDAQAEGKAAAEASVGEEAAADRMALFLDEAEEAARAELGDLAEAARLLFSVDGGGTWSAEEQEWKLRLVSGLYCLPCIVTARIALRLGACVLEQPIEVTKMNTRALSIILAQLLFSTALRTEDELRATKFQAVMQRLLELRDRLWWLR
eukprot:TRINITY_DN21316_c0_g1_i1.p1 TRINITY_DN21316_c0_g1~~TRINITY_DN21316_c0_g1_i1.p1  ORF type:complete len:418 (+),score=157.27 TRINITY_DN21316_c0_g1_i1:52-1254(+)